MGRRAGGGEGRGLGASFDESTLGPSTGKSASGAIVVEEEKEGVGEAIGGGGDGPDTLGQREAAEPFERGVGQIPLGPIGEEKEVVEQGSSGGGRRGPGALFDVATLGPAMGPIDEEEEEEVVDEAIPRGLIGEQKDVVEKGSGCGEGRGPGVSFEDVTLGTAMWPTGEEEEEEAVDEVIGGSGGAATAEDVLGEEDEEEEIGVIDEAIGGGGGAGAAEYFLGQRETKEPVVHGEGKTPIGRIGKEEEPVEKAIGCGGGSVGSVKGAHGLGEAEEPSECGEAKTDPAEAGRDRCRGPVRLGGPPPDGEARCPEPSIGSDVRFASYDPILISTSTILGSANCDSLLGQLCINAPVGLCSALSNSLQEPILSGKARLINMLPSPGGGDLVNGANQNFRDCLHEPILCGNVPSIGMLSGLGGENTVSDNLATAPQPGEEGAYPSTLTGPTRSSARLNSARKISVLERAKLRKVALREGQTSGGTSLPRHWNNNKVLEKSALCGVKLSGVEAEELRKYLLRG